MIAKRSIYLVEAPTQYALASTFLRFQEYYESPRFRSKVFSLEEYMDWYAEKNGSFSYYEDWTGFNFPSRVLKPFKEGRFDPLSQREQELLKALEGIPKPSYVIGTTKPLDLPTVKHEFVHGLFYTVPAYRHKVLRCLQKFNTVGFCRALKAAGYHKAVWHDEVNAYAMMCAGDLVKDGLRLAVIRQLRKALREVFKASFEYDLRQMREDDILKQIHEIRI